MYSSHNESVILSNNILLLQYNLTHQLQWPIKWWKVHLKSTKQQIVFTGLFLTLFTFAYMSHSFNPIKKYSNKNHMVFKIYIYIF